MTDDTPNRTRRTMLAGLGGAFAVALAGCATNSEQTAEGTLTDAPEQTTEPSTATETTESGATETVVDVDDQGATAIQSEALEAQLADLPTDELSDGEIAGLKFMREEEKLAHDVYAELGEEFGYRVFENIAASEQTHTDAVAFLLEKYDLSDPVTGNPGTFSNADLQSLYDNLLETGMQSAEAALRVGAEVEEVDIVDIQERADATDEAAITLVYENLIRGSRNHLRAFVRILDREGTTYSPQHLSQAEYDEIISSSIERGSQHGKQ
jgi:hypothetical protein